MTRRRAETRPGKENERRDDKNVGDVDERF